MALTYDIEKDPLYQKGIAKGEETGLKKGKLETQRLTALRCLKKGMSIFDTAELTDLSVEEVEALTDRLKA
jgi:predicted transposase/invertase (TIGR01784 family)